MADRTVPVELTNLVMVEDESERVLVEKRVKPGWEGLVFPGGHVEKRELILDSAVREVLEETGVIIDTPRLVGIQEFVHPDASRYIVFLCKAKAIGGKLHGSEEGDVFWMDLEELKASEHRMPNYFANILKVFLHDELSEYGLIQLREGEYEFDVSIM